MHSQACEFNKIRALRNKVPDGYREEESRNPSRLRITQVKYEDAAQAGLVRLTSKKRDGWTFHFPHDHFSPDSPLVSA